MAPSRRPRNAQENSQPLYEDDTEHDTDTEIPKPTKKHARKRLSEARLGDNDGSFIADGGRAPRVAVNINDDAAEKRKRRKSTKINVIEDIRAGPSSEGAQDGEGESSRLAKQKQQLNSVAPPTVINVPMDVMNSNYEEWMKLATDNKINTNNTWNFALIDYFHDMSLLRNNDDNSINFQRASCTLDGCVKIYTSRVDSVGNETGKLLSNLTSDGKDGEDEDQDSDNPDGESSQKKKKLHRPTSTLAKDPSQLQTKKLDLEWNVDPLFRKTCADFDEGGAQGLLMNHLGLGVGNDSALRVVFDASDSMRMMDVEEVVEEPEEEVDLNYLRAQYLPDLSVLEDKAIAHSLAEFAFGRSAFTLDDVAISQDVSAGQDDDDDGGFGGSPDAPGADQVQDFFVGADAVADDFGGDLGGGDEYGDGGSPTSDKPLGSGEGLPGPYVPFDPRRAPNERDLVMAMTDGSGDGGLMDYFDQTFLKNWAGPEHWKLRKITRKPETDPAAPAKGKKKEKKEVLKIDFTTPSEKSLKAAAEELFAPPAKGAGINLAGGSTKKGRKKGKEEKRDEHRLPDDMHFSSRQLVTLFLKPKFYLKMRGQRVRFNENGDGEVDEDFWAQAAAGQGGRGQDSDETAHGGAIPFNTQFFHDDYDDGPGFDDGDGYDGDGSGGADADAGEQDLLAATQGQTRRVKPETVNYAKRAKRVDVRKLKESIWKGLEIVIAPSQDEEEMDVDEPLQPTDPREARTFDTVITRLQQTYPSEKMAEISTSFCFICLLHLANEQGLKIEGSNLPSGAGGEFSTETTDKQVGNIWNLKIYRDPTAARSA